MQKEIILYFDEPKEIHIDFYNYSYDHEYPSQTIRVEAKTIKIKYCHGDIGDACYITNATSMELIDSNDDSIYHTVSLFKESQVRMINRDSQTIIEIY